MRWIGSYIHQRYPRVAFFQFFFGVVVFALIAGRRLAVNPPQDIVDTIEAFIRAGSFAMIAFGVTGGIGTMILLGRDWTEWPRFASGFFVGLEKQVRFEKSVAPQKVYRICRCTSG